MCILHVLPMMGETCVQVITYIGDPISARSRSLSTASSSTARHTHWRRRGSSANLWEQCPQAHEVVTAALLLLVPIHPRPCPHILAPQSIVIIVVAVDCNIDVDVDVVIVIAGSASTATISQHPPASGHPNTSSIHRWRHRTHSKSGRLGTTLLALSLW